MVLCETLVNTDIPRRDKMREAVIYGWKKLFRELKEDLSVSLHILSSIFINFDQ